MMAYAREDLLVEISERLKAMRIQEATHYVVPDYLAADWQRRLRDGPDRDADAADGAAGAPSSSSSGAAAVVRDGRASAPSAASGASSGVSSQINEVWREKICEWCYQVVDHFDFNREDVSVAMSFLDRYLATRTVNRRIFQLAAMTSLYLAIKLYEPGKLRMASLIDLSRGYFLAEHIVTMEDSILQSLHWHVHPPTPYAFCGDLMLLVPEELPARARQDATELARFLTELSVCDYWFVDKKPSAIALAAIVNALELPGPRRVAPRHKVAFLHRVVDVGLDIANDAEIVGCYERLRAMYVAGGYAPGLEEEGPARDATVSPTGVADGLAGEDVADEEALEMECA